MPAIGDFGLSNEVLAIAPAYAQLTAEAAAVAFPQRNAASGRGGSLAIVQLVGVLTKSKMLDARGSINSLAASDDVGEILLLVDSPGGSVAGVDDLNAAVSRAASRKRVTAFIEDLGASAAYYAIAGATEIVCNRTAVVGSIGVYVVLVDASEAFEREGVKFFVVRAGKHKGGEYYGAKVTPEVLEHAQGRVDTMARHFVNAVARGRRMTPAKAQELADGRTFIGSQAIAAGLVDRIALFEDLVGEAHGRVQSLAYARLSGAPALAKFRELHEAAAPGVAFSTVGPTAEAILAQHPELYCAAISHQAQATKKPEPAMLWTRERRRFDEVHGLGNSLKGNQ